MKKSALKKISSYNTPDFSQSQNSSVDTTKMIKIGEASKLLGVSIDTLRRWERKGWLKTYKTPGGTRLYDKNQLQKLNPSLKKGPKELISPLVKIQSQESIEKTQIQPQVQAKQISQPAVDLQQNISISLKSDQPALTEIKPVAPQVIEETTYGGEETILPGGEKIQTVYVKFKRTLFSIALLLIISTALSVPGYFLTNYIINTKTASNITSNIKNSGFSNGSDFTRTLVGLFSPDISQKFFKNYPPGSPPGYIARKLNIELNPASQRDLGYLRGGSSDPSANSVYLNGDKFSRTNGSVLAQSTPSASYLQFNIDTEINGNLSVYTASVSGKLFADTLNTGFGDNELYPMDQPLLTSSAVSFASIAGSTINLSGASNQITLANTIISTQTNGSGAFTVSIPTLSAAGNFVIDNVSQTLTNKTISGSNNTFSNIPTSALSSSSITVSAGSGLSGGGSVSLGGSVTLSNSGVTSITGTANRVIASASTGGVTLSLPQDIATTSDVEFDSLELTSGVLLNGTTSGTITLVAPASVTSYTLTLPADDGSNNYVLTTNGSGTTSWQVVGGGACANCVLTDPSTSQTVTPTSSTAIGLSIAQASGGSVDVFNVTNNAGSTKYFQVNSSGNISIAQTLTLGTGTVGIYTGSGAPASGLGANGDYYFRNDGTNGNTSLYYKVGGSWIAAGGGSLQNAYDVGSTITTSSGNSVAITLADVATPTQFSVTQQDPAGTAAIYLNNANTSGTNTNGILVEQTAAGTLTNGINITQTSGTLTNGLNFSGTLTNLINSTNFTVSNAGVITAATNETINGIDISSGSISDVEGYTQSTGAFAFSGGGNFSIDSAGLDLTTGGAVSGVTGYSQASGAFSATGLSSGTVSVTGANLALATVTSGDITLTTATATNLVNVLTGNLKVGNGTPTLTQDGEDGYVEGTFEVDGVATFGSNVGIGTTAPSTLFEVGATSTSSITASITNINSGTAAYSELLVRNGTTNTVDDSLRIMTMGTGFTTTGGFVQDSGVVDADVNLSNGLSIMTRASAPIRFYTAGHTNERLRITSDGNVGIGTTAPNNRLEVLSTTSPQLRVAYDTSNYSTTAVSSAGAVTFDAAGSSAGFTFSDSLTLAANQSFTMSSGTGSFLQTYSGTGSDIHNITVNSTASSGTQEPVSYNLTNNLSGTATSYVGVDISYQNASTLSHGDTIFRVLAENNASGSDAISTMVRIHNNDADQATNDAVLITSTSTAITDALDLSDSDIVNAINAGANFITFDGIRVFEGSTGTLTVEDTSGNDLCTITDAGSTGNLACTGNITGASTGTVGYWSRSGTTLSPATSGDDIDVDHAAFGSSASVSSTDVLTIAETVNPSSDTRQGINNIITSDTSFASGALYSAVLRASNSAAAGTSNWVAGANINGRNTGAGTLSAAIGAYIGAENTSTGTITSAYGIRTYANNSNASGTITNLYSVLIENPSNSGTLTTSYGLYLADQTAGSTDYGIYIAGADNYALYSADSGAVSYFAGNIGVGTTGPGAQIEIKEAVSGAQANLLRGVNENGGYSFYFHTDLNNHTDFGLQGPSALSHDFNTYWQSYINNANYATAGGLALGSASTNTGFGIYVADSANGAGYFAGNVGIGDSTPNARLEVGNGTDNLQISSTGDLTFVDANDGASITGPAGGALAIAGGSSQNITLTPGAATGLANILTGNLKVGNGTPTVTQDGEDAYIEGTFEADGNARFDGLVGISGSGSDSQLYITNTAFAGSAGAGRAVQVATTFSSAVTGSAYGVISTVNTEAAAYTLTNLASLFAGTNTAGTGSTITNNYGLFVDDQTAGTNDYGIRVDAADTATIWVSGGADNTTANAGIMFGSSRDTNLYRSAANILYTDDAFTSGAGSITSFSTTNEFAFLGGSDGNIELSDSSDNFTYVDFKNSAADDYDGRVGYASATDNMNFYIAGGASPTLQVSTTTLTFTGTTLTASSLATFTTAATLGMTSTTTLNLGTSATINAAATALNIQADGTPDVNIAGGSSATGCTVANSTGNLTCTGNITGSGSGTVGYWSRSGTTLSPATSADSISMSGSFATTSTSSNAFGGSGLSSVILRVTGSLSNSYGIYVDPSLDPADGTSGRTVYIGPTIVATAAETVPVATNLWLEPLGKSGTGTITNASTLYINGAPSGGSSNYALYSVSGNSYFGGNIGINDTTPTEGTLRVSTTQTSSTTNYNAGIYNSTNATSIASSASLIGIYNLYTTSHSSNTASEIRGADLQSSFNSTMGAQATVGVSNLYAVYTSNNVGGTAPVGTVSNATNIMVDSTYFGGATGAADVVFTNKYGIYINNQGSDGTAGSGTFSIGTSYGLYLANQTGANTSYSIYSNGGTNYFAGNTGVGTTPSYQFHVNGTAANTADSRVTSLNSTLAITSQYQSGVYASATLSPASASTATFASIKSVPYSQSANLASANINAFEAIPYFDPGSAATYGSVRGLYTKAFAATVNATITDNIGVYIDNADSTGTITTNYGLYMADQTAGDTTDFGIYIAGADSYALYSADSGALSYFAGNVGIGTTAPGSLLALSGGNLTITGGVARVQVGSVSSPSYQFSGDTDSGLYQSAADNIDFSTAGTNRLNISSSGLTLGTGGDIIFANGETVDNDTNNQINLGLGASGTLLLTSTTTATITNSAGALGVNATATGLNLQADGSIDVNIAGGASATGCTVANSTGNLTCTGNITGSSSGTVGFWSRSSTTLSPATANDIVSIATTNTTGADLALTNTGVYTGTGIFNLTANSATTGNLMSLTATGLTTGELISMDSTYSPSDGSNNEAIDINLTNSPSTLANTLRGIDLTVTDSTALANVTYGYRSTITMTGNAAKIGRAVEGNVTSSSTTADSLNAGYFTTTATGNAARTGNNTLVATANTSSTTADNLIALYGITSATGILTTGTRNNYGIVSQPASTAASTGGTNNVYGAYINPSSTLSNPGITDTATNNVYGLSISTVSTVASDCTTNCTSTQYGILINNGTSSTNGTSSKYGLYIANQTGADNNYHLYVAATSTATSGVNQNGGYFGYTVNPGSATSATTYYDDVIASISTSANAIDHTNSVVRAAVFVPTHAGTGTLGTTNGASAATYNTSSGTISSAQGFNSSLSQNSGTISNYFGYLASVNSNAGTVTNTYGFYAGDLTTGTQTNTPWSFYASDTSARNYFAGNTGIGDDNSPDALFEISSSDTDGGDFLLTNTGIGTSGTVASIVSNSTTTGDIFSLSATALTTGTAMTLSGPSSTGVTDHFVKVTSDVGASSALVNLSPDFSGSAVTAYGLRLDSTDSTANANINYGIFNDMTLSGNAAKQPFAYYGRISTSSTTADTLKTAFFTTSATGALSTGTRTLYGVQSNPVSTAASTGGALSVYGLFANPSSTLSNPGLTDATTNTVYGVYTAPVLTLAADCGASCTSTQYGVYVDNGTSSTNGTSTKYGIYINTQSGADTNYALYSAATAHSYFAGSLGIGVTSVVTAASKLEISTAGDDQGIYGTASGTHIFSLSRQTNDLSIAAFSGIGFDVNQTSTNPDASYAMYIKSDGNVGIGNTNPASFILQTSGSIGPNADDTYDLGSSSLRWRDIYLGPASMHIGTSTTDEGLITYDTTNNIMQFTTDSTANGDISFFTDDLYLDKSSGNVGIGTTAPGALLHGVSGANGANTAGDALGTYNLTGATNASGILQISSNTDQAADTGGSIGFAGRSAANTANTQWGFIRGYKENSSAGNGNAYMSFVVRQDGTGLNERLRINSSGYVGIGTTNPFDRLSNTTSNIVDQSGTGTTGGTGITWSGSAAGYMMGLANTSSAANANGLNIRITATAATNRILTLDSNGTDRMIVQGDGNVGIGTTSAGTMLDVASTFTTQTVGRITGNSLTTGTLLNLTSTSTALAGTATTGNGLLGNMTWAPGSATTATGDLFRLHIGPNGTTTGSLFNIVDDTSSIFAVSETAFTTSLPSNFTASGDVSVAYDIQFTNPTSSYIKSAAPLYMVSGETFNSSNLTLQTYNTGSIVLETTTTGSTLIPNGNVGIGTTAPLTYLHVKGVNVGNRGQLSLEGSDYAMISYYSGPTTTTNLEAYQYVDMTNSEWIFQEYNNGSLGEISLNPGGGNVGIGTASTDSLLHVNSSAANTGAHIGNSVIGVWTGSTAYMGITHNSLRATAGSWALYQGSGGDTYLNSASGQGVFLRTANGIISNNTSAHYACYNSGTGQVTYGTSCTSSSRTTKHDINNLDEGSGLNEIMRLNPVSFVYNEDQNADPGTMVGFIAEEAEAVDPRLVIYGADGRIQSFRYENLTAILTKAVQQLNRKVDNIAVSNGQFTLDSEGYLQMGNVKMDKIVVSGDINISGKATASSFALDSSKFNMTGALASVPVDSTGKVSVADAVNALDSKLGNLESKQASQSAELVQARILGEAAVAQAESLDAKVASTSANLASLSAQIQELLNSTSDSTDSSSLPSSPDDGLTPPQELLTASSSATLANLKVTDNLSALNLGVMDATVSATFKSLGETFLGKTTIAGDFTADATFSIADGRSVNAFPTLYLQDSPLALNLDIFNGKVKIGNTGNVEAESLALGDQSVGTATLTAGQTEITVPTTLINGNSKVFLTPLSPVAGNLYVSQLTNGSGFKVKISQPNLSDVKFNWLIIGERQ